ncbi:MAG TPA: hypothetical protein VHW66_23515 [Stellaceae bacterium]|jgi:hypothetical protein|nr:hypothetical protein [Stellaceae bacterium]
MTEPIAEPIAEPVAGPALPPPPAPVQRRRRAALVLAIGLAVVVAVIAAAVFWTPELMSALPWGSSAKSDEVQALAARLDRVEAAQAGQSKALATAGSAEKSTLGQLDQRIHALETKPPPPPPDLSGIQQQIAGVSTRLDALDKTVQARQAGDPTDAALALLSLQIGEAVRIAHPFPAEYEEFAALAKTRPELAAAAAPLEQPAIDGVASRAVLARELHALAGKVATVAAPPAKDGWTGRVWAQLRGLVTIRRIDGAGQTPDQIAMTSAEKAMAQGDLASAVDAVRKLSDADTAKPWLQLATARLQVEEALHKITTLLAARLGNAANTKPPG